MSRESDIIALCESVLEAKPNDWDNPNGPYESTCPICYKMTTGIPYSEMYDIEHETNCGYLIAKDLMTNIKPTTNKGEQR